MKTRNDEKPANVIFGFLQHIFHPNQTRIDKSTTFIFKRHITTIKLSTKPHINLFCVFW